MPHILFLDPETKEETAFDANVEFMDSDEVPPDWELEEWKEYISFLEGYYETSDKKEILLKMYLDDKMPVWDRKEQTVKIVRKDEPEDDVSGYRHSHEVSHEPDEKPIFPR
jgi:uncharacterized protein YktA (UPF0223 family)